MKHTPISLTLVRLLEDTFVLLPNNLAIPKRNGTRP